MPQRLEPQLGLYQIYGSRTALPRQTVAFVVAKKEKDWPLLAAP